jgi:hypothetical protein
MIHGDDYTFYTSWTEILMQFRVLLALITEL